MKFFYAIFVVALLAILTVTSSSAITIDGIADAAYGSAIATQAIGTVAGDNTYGNQGIANGSELDAAYGFVSNGVLYLVMAGNFNSLPVDMGGTAPNDYLNIFFMTGAGGDHTLGTNYTATYNGRINHMGTGGGDLMDGSPGLTFDTGFNANYWIGVNVGYDEALDATNTMFVDYQVVCSNCASAYFGSVISTNDPPLILTNVYFGSTIQVALNNTNLFGVDANACYLDTTGGVQAVAAAAVRTGAELAIPLAAIGNPTGTIYVCSFITDKYFLTMYNQVLGPVWDGTSGYCQSFLAGGAPDQVNFGSYPGQHYFPISVPACDVILANPSSVSFASTGGVGSVSVANSGGCALTVTTSTNWFTITGSSGLGSGNGFFTYSVSSNVNSIQTRTGQFFITDTDALGNIITQAVTISQVGVPAPPLSPYFTVDGTRDTTYGCPIVVQAIGTGFGDNSFTNLLAAGGSELDAAYGAVQNNTLFLLLAGNLEFNFNAIEIFIMTDTNGVSTLSTNNNQTAVGGNAVHALAVQGLTFDGGFKPNYWIGVNGGGSPSTLYFDYAQLWPGGTNNPTGTATNGYYLGSTTSTNGTILGGNNLFGIQGTINNSSTGGVEGTSCSTNYLGQAQSIAAATVTNGLELGIPLGAIGSPTGTIYVCAFVSGGGNHTYLSNQFLPPIGTNDIVTPNCQGNLGNTNNLNLATLLGGPHFFAVGPEMRVTSVQQSGTAINVKYVTAASTNLSYQLQRTGALTNNTTWANVGGLQLGTGGILTGTDPFGATNFPAQFYRVRQTPLCP